MAHVDLDALRDKYRQERDKRLRPAGTDQYNFAEGKLEHFGDDPYAPPSARRDPLHGELDVLIIGTGFGGIQAGATLRTAGVDNFRMLDIAADFGGTWYWNRYPGVRCDVESYVYLPYLEETGYIPTERYVTGAEIFEYCQRLGRHFGLYERAVFQTKVTGMDWDDGAKRWIVTTSAGDRFAARFVTTQSGIFCRPQLPGIPGIETFKGRAFHSARWDFEYTGGDSNGGMDRLHDKRVGVIGTGATGLQVVPHLAAAAAQLTVFQRTPTAVGVRDNAPTDIEWFKSQAPGWQKQRIESFNQLSCGENADCPVDDGWARFFRHINAAVALIPEDERTPERIGEAVEAADYGWNEEIRGRVDSIVRDQRKAAALKAYYRTLCKRPGFSDDYLPSFDRENVAIVDTAESGIDRMTEHGIVVDGVEHKLDCLVFATGFELGTTWAHQAGYDIVSRNGARLSEKWVDGMRTYHGLFTHGYPNIFFLGLTQTGSTISVPHMLQEQIDHVTFIVKHCLTEGLTTVEATVDAESEWQQVIASYNEVRRPFQEACTPGYFNAEGKPEDRRSAIGSGIFQPSTAFFAMLDEWRKAGDFKGLEVS
jgi:cyclohexanone monooxygenase